MVGCHGTQCGFCTPGIVMSLAAFGEKAVDAHAAADQRRAVGQPVPLHRLPADRRRRAAGLRRAGRRAARCRTRTNWRC
jgi:hypothetical protein